MMLDFLGNREKDKALKEAAAAIETTVIKVTREKIKSPHVSVIDPEQLSHAPGLREAADGAVWNVAVENLRHSSEPGVVQMIQ